MKKFLKFGFMTDTYPIMFVNQNAMFMINKNSRQVVELDEKNLKMILPDYYKEFINTLPVLYSDLTNQRKKKWLRKKRNKDLILNSFCDNYEKQSLIFKLTNKEQPLLLLDLSHIDENWY